MSAKLNWKEIGRFVAVLVQLITVVTNVFKKVRVGPEIVEWLVGPGKEYFEGWLKNLTEEYKWQNPQIVTTSVAVLKAEIDTDIDPKLPFDGAKVEHHAKMGKVTIEKKDGELWIDGKRVTLYRSQRQSGMNTIVGHQLRKELTGKPVLNARVFDFLLENRDFIPESWGKNDTGNNNRILFLGTIYSGCGGLCAYCLCWRARVQDRDYFWIDDSLDSDNFVALLAL